MQHSEKKKQTLSHFAEFTLPTESVESILVRQLRNLNSVKTEPSYNPLKDYLGIENEATLHKLFSVENEHSCKTVADTLKEIFPVLVVHWSENPIPGSGKYARMQQANILLELIEIFNWLEYYGVKPKYE